MAFENRIFLVLMTLVSGATTTIHQKDDHRIGVVNVGSVPTWSNDILHMKGHYFGVLNQIKQITLPWKPFVDISRRTTTESYLNTNHSAIKFKAWKAKWLTAHYGTCGRQMYQPNFQRTKIIGGSTARKGSWPWMISLVFEPFRQAICGGVVIDNKWILTAAHCSDRPFFQDFTKMIVRVGIHNASYFSEAATEQPRKIINVYKHPLYDGFGRSQRGDPFVFDNDIALVKLDKPLTYNDFVQPICLPTVSRTKQRKCVITGWGRQKVPSESKNTSIDDSAWPQLLKQAIVPVISTQACAKNTGYGDKISRNMICAGYPEGKTDSCAGDSGGPLQCRSTNGRWYTEGITSWGGSSYTECAQPHQPGVYTRVYNFREWILCVLFSDATKAKD